MKFKLIILLLCVVFLLNPTQGETEENITVEIHQIWDFFNNKDASVTEIITSNGDINISGNIGFQENSNIFDYFVYINDSNSHPETIIYRPTVGKVIDVPNISLMENKKIIRKYTVLNISKPTTFEFTKFIHIKKGLSWFPFDSYIFEYYFPVNSYNQSYSSDIIFPASFKIEDGYVKSRQPIIETQKIGGEWITFTSEYRIEKIPESYIIEDYQYKAYVPLKNIPNTILIKKHNGNIKDITYKFLRMKYVYERPFLFKLIFGISISLMLLVYHFSIPLNTNTKRKTFLLTITSIWVGQEGVSFLQGHRPLDILFYDLTIFIVFLIIFVNEYLSSTKK